MLFLLKQFEAQTHLARKSFSAIIVYRFLRWPILTIRGELTVNFVTVIQEKLRVFRKNL